MIRSSHKGLNLTSDTVCHVFLLNPVMMFVAADRDFVSLLLLDFEAIAN